MLPTNGIKLTRTIAPDLPRSCQRLTEIARLIQQMRIYKMAEKPIRISSRPEPLGVVVMFSVMASLSPAAIADIPSVAPRMPATIIIAP